MDYTDEIGALALVAGVEEHGVLHDVGVDFALGHCIVGFQAGGEPLGTSKNSNCRGKNRLD
jgi:hypothetical protein